MNIVRSLASLSCSASPENEPQGSVARTLEAWEPCTARPASQPLESIVQTPIVAGCTETRCATRSRHSLQSMSSYPVTFYERIPQHVAVLCVFVLFTQSAKNDTVIATVGTDRYTNLTKTMWKDFISA